MALAAKVLSLGYEPQPKQRLLHETKARQILYGGAAGGGKSRSLRWDLIYWCLQVPGLDTFLFRRTLDELDDNHIRRLKEEVPPELAKYNETKKRLEFVNGAGINFSYCEKEADVTRYQGAEMHVLAIDEAAHLTEYQIGYLITRTRLGGFSERVPPEYRPYLPRIVMASNPGGPGHNFLKERFIDPAPPMTMFEDVKIGWPTIFIPARMSDNAHLDASYEKQFEGLPSELARALREGDWDAVVGQALPLSKERHQLPDFPIPRHWTRFMSLDWGTAKPFSAGWYAVAEGGVEWVSPSGRVLYVTELVVRGKVVARIPTGAIVRYAEWYGWSGKRDEGCRLGADTVGRGCLDRETERGDFVDYRVADSAMWAQHDGPSAAERFQKADSRLILRQSVKDRTQNYAEYLARLHGEEGLPMFYITQSCRHYWRTVPTLILDEVDPNKGPGEKQENHCYDESSYGLRSRPYLTSKDERENTAYRERLRKARRVGGSRYAT